MKITLKAARVNAGLSQEQVAAKMHKSKATIGFWENGKAKMDLANFTVLCDLYKVKKEDILMPVTLKKVKTNERAYQD